MIASEPEAEVRGADQTRLRILTATRELFATRGTRGTTTREVAVRAGVNEATLFRHFGTKQQLVDAMLDHFSRIQTAWDALVVAEAYESLEEQLRALAAASIEAITRKQDIIRMTLAEEIVNPDGVSCAWRAPSEARNKLVEFFERKTASGELKGNPEFLACSFMSISFAYVMGRKIWGPFDRTAEQIVPSIVDLFLNGARA